ncbi:MAG: hypothetical protein LBP33_10885 [Candidatus Adiutrix sp.]|nr:hypothetical protein [Candidatus Adiutrix sp.]
MAINKIPFFRLAGLARGRKKRNRALLERLAAANLALKEPWEISGEVGAGPDDLAFLEALARLPGAWHDYEFSETRRPGDQARLAALGLIYLSLFPRKIYLSDAGRFLLSLSAPRPEPQAGGSSQ